MYDTISEALADGWLYFPCAFPTTHIYYVRGVEVVTKQELLRKDVS